VVVEVDLDQILNVEQLVDPVLEMQRMLLKLLLVVLEIHLL
tara:strand:+ start:61 stop:183 length:123 start_codon:yes stop_codon:yes gene_type:complete